MKTSSHRYRPDFVFNGLDVRKQGEMAFLQPKGDRGSGFHHKLTEKPVEMSITEEVKEAITTLVRLQKSQSQQSPERAEQTDYGIWPRSVTVSPLQIFLFFEETELVGRQIGLVKFGDGRFLLNEVFRGKPYQVLSNVAFRRWVRELNIHIRHRFPIAQEQGAQAVMSGAGKPVKKGILVFTGAGIEECLGGMGE